MSLVLFLSTNDLIEFIFQFKFFNHNRANWGSSLIPYYNDIPSVQNYLDFEMGDIPINLRSL